VPAEVLASILRQIGVLASLWCFIDCSPQSAALKKKRMGLASLWRFWPLYDVSVICVKNTISVCEK
jgi:hypothetical protein